MKGKFSLSESDEKPNLDDIKPFFDIAHTLTIIIGRTQMKVGRLLELERGDIVELTKSAGESLDVFANDKLIAKGDVTVIDDRFAVRITDIYSPDEEEKN